MLLNGFDGNYFVKTFAFVHLELKFKFVVLSTNSVDSFISFRRIFIYTFSFMQSTHYPFQNLAKPEVSVQFFKVFQHHLCF